VHRVVSLYKKRQGGFTIVELLIVIVVIGILAAITIVAFNGVQNRAHNTAKIQAAHQLAKKFEAAVVEHGVNLGANAPYCLPVETDDTAGNDVARCETMAVGGSYIWREKAVANAMLESTGLTNLKFPDTELIGANGTKYRGISVTFGSGGWGMNGVRQPFFLYFTLKGQNQDCNSSYSIGHNPGNDNTNSPLTALTKRPFYASSNGVTRCAYTFPQPESL